MIGLTDGIELDSGLASPLAGAPRETGSARQSLCKGCGYCRLHCCCFAWGTGGFKPGFEGKCDHIAHVSGEAKPKHEFAGELGGPCAICGESGYNHR